MPSWGRLCLPWKLMNRDTERLARTSKLAGVRADEPPSCQQGQSSGNLSRGGHFRFSGATFIELPPLHIVARIVDWNTYLRLGRRNVRSGRNKIQRDRGGAGEYVLEPARAASVVIFTFDINFPDVYRIGRPIRCITLINYFNGSRPLMRATWARLYERPPVSSILLIDFSTPLRGIDCVRVFPLIRGLIIPSRLCSLMFSREFVLFYMANKWGNSPVKREIIWLLLFSL